MRFHLLILFLLISINISASEFFQNIKTDALSPYAPEAFPIVEIGAGLTALTYLFKQSNLQSNIAQSKPLGKYSKIGYDLGQLLPNAAYALVMGSNYLITKDPKSLERTELILKATLYSDLTTEIMKRTFNEKRPNGGKLSFPSGHTTCAFAFASVITMEHSLPWGIAANLMASFVGFSRMNDNAHYLHDVIAGATIGTMYGVGLYYANVKQTEVNKDAKTTVLFLVPIKAGLASSFIMNY